MTNSAPKDLDLGIDLVVAGAPFAAICDRNSTSFELLNSELISELAISREWWLFATIFAREIRFTEVERDLFRCCSSDAL